MTKIQKALKRQRNRIKNDLIALCEDNVENANAIREYFGENPEELPDWGSIGEPS